MAFWAPVSAEEAADDGGWGWMFFIEAFYYDYSPQICSALTLEDEDSTGKELSQFRAQVKKEKLCNFPNPPLLPHPSILTCAV